MTLLASAQGWHALLFYLFAGMTLVFAAGVLFSSNIVRMALYLIVSLGATAGLFLLAGAEFLGAMQLMIYVGGTLVLLVFGVMLTARSQFVSLRTRSGDWLLSGLLGGVLLLLLCYTLTRVGDWRAPPPAGGTPLAQWQTTSALGLALVGVRADALPQQNAALRGGMSGYLLPFVIVSVHLLVVLIGAAYMARAREDQSPRD